MSSNMTVENNVVVAVDGLDEEYGAVRYAAGEAWRLGAALEVVHVVPAYVPTGSMVMMPIPMDSFRSYGAQILVRARQAAVDTAPQVSVSTHLRTGGVVQQLLDVARRARLVVLGGRGSSSLNRLWTGGTLTGVASQAACPVIAVPAGCHDRPLQHRIVVGFKSPAYAARLFDAAFALAEELRAELVVLHAWRLHGVYDDIIASPAEVERWQREGIELIEEELVGYREAFPGVRVRVYVRHEDAAGALVRATCGADRLLIERPVHGGLVNHLGRTARAVLREAHCPVEVLPPIAPGSAPSATTAQQRSAQLVP